MGSPFSSSPKSFQSSGAMTSLSAMPSPTVMACAGRRVDCVSDVTPTIRRGDPRFTFRLPRGWYGRRHAARRVLLVVDAAVEDVLVRRVVVDLRASTSPARAPRRKFRIFQRRGDPRCLVDAGRCRPLRGAASTAGPQMRCRARQSRSVERCASLSGGRQASATAGGGFLELRRGLALRVAGYCCKTNWLCDVAACKTLGMTRKQAGRRRVAAAIASVACGFLLHPFVREQALLAQKSIVCIYGASPPG